MSENTRLKALRITLVLVGVTFIVGLPLLMYRLWPSGWAWDSGHTDSGMMIIGVYATLGAFLIAAARNPLNHLSLIRFTAWSSLVHAAIMFFQSFENSGNHGHLVGDVPALVIVGALLVILTPRRDVAQSLQRAA